MFRGVKTCSKCGVLKDRSRFCKKLKGINSCCRDCRSEYDKTRYRKDPKKFIADACAWRKRNPDRVTRNLLWREYRMTVEEYAAMLSAQGGVCASCEGAAKGRWKSRLHVDHDHSTGKVRGLLCQNCNIALGQLKDSVSTIEKLLEYMKKHRNP